MKKLLKLWRWLDDNILLLCSIAFIFVITLYPKIPLIRLDYTYIAIRAEDFFVALLFTLYTIQLIRKKISIPWKLGKPFLFFWGSIVLSLLCGLFLTHTIIHKNIAILHTLRRVEYMGMFFVAFASVRSFRSFTLLLLSLLGSMLLVSIYGLGQRFIGFPAVSTMNSEFAKGILLTLTPEARLSSTFAGHYDLAAYIIFLLPICIGLAISIGNKHHGMITSTVQAPIIVMYSYVRVFFRKIHGLFDKHIHDISLSSALQKPQQFDLTARDFVILIIISVGASVVTAHILSSYFVSIISLLSLSLVFFLIAYLYARKASLMFIAFLGVLVLVLTASRTSFIAYVLVVPAFLIFFKKYKYLIALTLVTILFMTFSQTLSQRFLDTFQIKQFLINDKTGEVHVVQGGSGMDLPAGSKIISKIDKSGKETAASRKLREELLHDASSGASLEADYTTVSGVAADTSSETRFREEWPRAIRKFLSNPILGVGASAIDPEYSTGNTDNDYLRWLAEFGLLGTLSFLLIFFVIFEEILQAVPSIHVSMRPLFYGPLFGLAALFINAGYIDVFEASKLAFVLWYTLGIFIGVLHNKHEEN